MQLSEQLENRLERFCERLIDQDAASVIVQPKKRSEGFWFGGGNMVRDSKGTLYLVGRYRNAGDSRTGLFAGERGLELAVFRSDDQAQSFEKVLSCSKQDLTVAGKKVLSIEGTALRLTEQGAELFLSTEKDVPYPAELKGFQKPGTGVWSIDYISAPTVEALDPKNIRPLFHSDDPRWLHLKDPVLHESAAGGSLLIGCSHPFNWSSTGSFYAVRKMLKMGADSTNEISTAGGPSLTEEPSSGEGAGTDPIVLNGPVFDVPAFTPPVFDFFSRGTTWDVAMARVTAALTVPKVGLFTDGPQVTVLFYDGGECVRKLGEHTKAMKRPRGYSCEELGGAAYFVDGSIDHSIRLSRLFPSFISKRGTGSSRYVDVLETEEGFYATWEQSQDDLSQPLVMNYLSREEMTSLLS